MKLLVASVLVFAVVAEGISYHSKVGIPTAARLRQQEARLIDGDLTDISSVPYQAGVIVHFLQIFTSVCGGTLIAPDSILTAAHCYSDGSFVAEYFTIVLGSTRLFSGGTRLTSRDVTVHPGWGSQSAVDNNIAIIHIPAVPTSEYIAPIALPTGDDDYTGMTAVASGFGITINGADITNNQVLTSSTFRVISNLECFAVFGPVISENVLCTSGDGGRGVCDGDTGGPLAVVGNDGLTLIGISSFFAANSCDQGYPSGYTRVGLYLDWINEVLSSKE